MRRYSDRLGKIKVMNQNRKTVRLNRHGKEILTEEGYENFIFEAFGIQAQSKHKRTIFKNAFAGAMKFEVKAEAKELRA